MRNLTQKLKAVWLLLTSKGYILTWVKNPEDEEIEAGFFFAGLDGEQIILFCDSLADEIEGELKAEEDERMANRIGAGMRDYINQIHLN